MVKIAILLADGFEEAEALVPADLLRRAGGDVALVSIHGDDFVTGAHGISFKTDTSLDRLDKSSLSCVLLPGGLKGTEALCESFAVRALVQYAAENGIYVAAICAAPSILGKMGLLEGRRYACYPGFDKDIPGGTRTGKKVEHDDIFITAEGMGVSFEFGFRLVELLFGFETATIMREQTRFA